MEKYLIVLGLFVLSCTPKSTVVSDIVQKPVVLTTWDNVPANEAAYHVLKSGGLAVDAIEAGIRITEVDTTDQSVGVGGLPDASGEVTLDACIMDHTGNAGSVTFLKNISHPISVARLVMDSTPHVMLSGQGAYDYAIQNGFKPENLLTQTARLQWETWKKDPSNKADNHDTIGMLAVDKEGRISGGCSTSGMAYKVPGRVGDSPIIGAGLFIDNTIGGATATGVGEEVMKTVGSFLIVELMRQGLSPQEACEEGVHRIAKFHPAPDFQIGYIALNKKGEIGAYAMQPGFVYAITVSGETTVNKSLAYND